LAYGRESAFQAACLITGVRFAMENVLLAVSLLSCIALIVAVLLQRSEGGALGMGGGGGSGGGLVSSRGAADTLVKATMVLAAIFLCSSLALTRLNAESRKDLSDVERTLSEQPADVISEALETEAITSEGEPVDLITEALETEAVDLVDEVTSDTENVSDEVSNENSTGNP
jgi:preprotein translocase subunit SecG